MESSLRENREIVESRRTVSKRSIVQYVRCRRIVSSSSPFPIVPLRVDRMIVAHLFPGG